MTDGIIKGTGNSRYLKTVADALTLYPTYQDFMAAFIAGTLPVDLNGINAEGWRQIGTALNKGNLLTDETADKLALKWTKIEKPMSEFAEGDIVWLNEGGILTPFWVAKHNYESGLNGTGRTLVVRKRTYGEPRVWNASNVNTYADSDADLFLNGEYKDLFNERMQAAMGATTFYYTVGGGNNTVTTLSRCIFLLSATECGISTESANVEGSILPIVDKMSIGPSFTRSPIISKTDSVWVVNGSGGFSSVAAGSTTGLGSYPAFTLSANFVPDAYYENSLGQISLTDLTASTPAMAFEALYRKDFGTPVIEAVADGVTNVAFDLGELETGWYRVTQEGSTNSSKKIVVGTNNTSYDKGSIMYLSPDNTAWQNKSGSLELYLLYDYLDFFLYSNDGYPYITGISFGTNIRLFAYRKTGGSTPVLMQFSTAFFTAGTKITLSKLPPLKEV